MVFAMKIYEVLFCDVDMSCVFLCIRDPDLLLTFDGGYLVMIVLECSYMILITFW